MKTPHILSFFAAVVILISSAAFCKAQSTSGNIVFIVDKKGDKYFDLRKTRNAEVEKVMILHITGLETSQQVADFTTKIKSSRGVNDFSVSDEIIDGKREATLSLTPKSTMSVFKQLMLANGVSTVIINGEKKNVSDLEIQNRNSK